MANRSLIQQMREEAAKARERRNITPTPGRKQEPSGIFHGEAKVFATSLVTTTNKTGCWRKQPRDIDDDFARETINELKSF